jgi:uncharacterized coiled-coil DUF342 family protein
MSTKERSTIDELLSDLKQQRDELRVRIHLGTQEAKEEWSRLEDKLFQLNQQFAPVKDAVGETADDLWASLKLLGGEIREGFSRIRKSL